jgi:hypothetical protein
LNSFVRVAKLANQIIDDFRVIWCGGVQFTPAIRLTRLDNSPAPRK